MKRSIAVVGLGYVGLPAAVALAREFSVIGFDVDRQRVRDLKEDRDRTGAVSSDELAKTGAFFTSEPEGMADADLYIVAVPTPVDEAKHPDLTALRKASRIVGSVLRPGDIVVYESTVYPGVTREVCGPILAETSGLTCGEEFFLGYSPERISPGEPDHTFERAVKVVSGQDERTLDIVAEVYGAVVTAGVHKASSIEVAEAAKVVENVQRDVNIAFVNELALIFQRLGIDTIEVLEAAGTKWNFLPFRPGLVGGHCIGVDPYYLATRAQEVGLTPQVIPAARAVNESMASYVAQETIRQLGRLSGRRIRPKVGILGLAFKENVPDLRNSRVPDIVAELESFGAAVMVHDPLCDPELARQNGLELWPLRDLANSDALVLAVPHQGLAASVVSLAVDGSHGCVVMDVKGAIPRGTLPADVIHWRL